MERKGSRIRGFKDSSGKRQETEDRRQETKGSTTLSFPHAFSGNPEDVMIPR